MRYEKYLEILLLRNDLYFYKHISIILGIALIIVASLGIYQSFNMPIQQIEVKANNLSMYKPILGGFWMPIGNETDYKEYQNLTDPEGKWICINIRNRTPEDILKTCQHETGHEIFNEYCNSNLTRCAELVKDNVNEDFARLCGNNITKCLDISNE